MSVHRSRLRFSAAAIVVALVAALALAVGPALPAGAQVGTGPELQIRRVDLANPSSASADFLYTGDAGAVSGAKLTANGQDVTKGAPQRLPDTTKEAVALVFDVGSAMDQSGALVSAKAGARTWLQGRTAAQQQSQLVAVYTTANGGQRIQDFTTDTTQLLAAIDQVGPLPADRSQDQASLWGAIHLAADNLGSHTNYQPNLMVMAGSAPGSGADKNAAFGSVTSAGASVFAAQLLSGSYNPGALESLVAQNGGVVRSTDQGTGMGDLVGGLGTTIDSDQYTMAFTSPVGVGSVVDLSLALGGQTATASAVAGSTVSGQANLNPQVISGSGGVSALQGNLGLILTVLVAMLAVGAFAYAVLMLFVRQDRLATALRPYDGALAGPSPDDQEDDGPRATSMATMAIVQRAVALTEQVAEQRGILSRAEAALERANLPLRAGEALFFYFAVVVVCLLLSVVLTRSVIIALIVGLAAALIPPAAVSFLAKRRKKAFLALLPDTLTLLSSTLRAGYSLMQGVEAVSQEVSEPMGLELRRVVSESRLGRPLEEALEGVADRMASADFAWAVMAIRIQREVGGNLSELLLTVAETMVARERLRRDVAALTAEGRVSAAVLGILPIGLGLVMFVVNPEYTSKLIDTTAGNVMLGVGIVAALIGFIWMKKLIEIEI